MGRNGYKPKWLWAEIVMGRNCHGPKCTADNLSNAKPLVQQRHPGDEFPVSQRGSAKGKQSVPVPILLMDIYLYRK